MFGNTVTEYQLTGTTNPYYILLFNADKDSVMFMPGWYSHFGLSHSWLGHYGSSHPVQQIC